MVLFLENNFAYSFLFTGISMVFWFLLNRDVFRHLRPPTELIILIFISFYAIEIVIYKLAFDPAALAISSGIILAVFQYITLTFLVLLFGFILIDNNERKQSVLIFYIIMGIVAHFYIFYGGTYLYFLFQVILFFSLFKRTTWLEKLTRTELWLYLIFFVALYYFHGTLPISAYSQRTELGDSLIWMTGPLYVSKLYRLYLLAMIVKAPVILIYNHAALARKLRMSALFQSTVPQFFQFILLLVIFFLFISGWQAQNLRMAIYNTIENIRQDTAPADLTWYRIPYEDKKGDLLHIPGCYPQRIERILPSLAAVRFECHGDEQESTTDHDAYFLISREKNSQSDELLLLRFDKALLNTVTRNLNLLAGSHISGYAEAPDEWQTRLYDLDFWQRDDRIKIYPFVFHSSDHPDALEYKLKDITGTDQSFILNFIEKVFGQYKIITGRIFMPVLNHDRTDHYFLMDLVAPLQAQSLSSPMLRMFLLLVGLYFLFNMFVLQRVIQFGEQINQIIVRKFSQLQAGIREISTGNLDYQVSIDGEDEFVELAQRFNYMRRQLKQSMEESKERERLDQELKIARDVQFSFLPATLPDVPGFNTVASLKTAQEVSGDFYDLIKVNETRYIFTIGDVSGKGSSAAFYMAQMISLLRFSLQFTEEPEDIAVRINEYFTRHTLDRQVFITAIIGRIDTEENRIRLVRAGHTSPILISDHGKKEVKEIDSGGMAIGLTSSGALFKEQLVPMEMNLDQGEILFLYTDGVTEAQIDQDDGETRIFGEERLLEFLASHSNTDIHRIHARLLENLEAFYGGTPRMDDQTMLLLQRATVPAG